MSTARVLNTVVDILGRVPIGVLQRLGAAAVWPAGLFRTRSWLVCHENIRRCFTHLPVSEQRRLARRAMQASGRLLLETAYAWSADVERCRALIVSVKGESQVDAIRGPIVFILPHLGNWEILNHYLGPRYELTHMYQQVRSDAHNNVVLARRRRSGTRFVPASHAGIREQIRRLRGGGAIGSMPDQEPAVHTGVFAPFFGIDCLTSNLIPDLVAKTGATPVVAWCKRLRDGAGFEVIMQPIAGELTPRAMNAAIEDAVLTAPEQYLWSYKRFRTRPDGEREPYQFRQHPVRVGFERAVTNVWLQASARLSIERLARIGAALGGLAHRLRVAPARVATTNLRHIDRPEIALASLREAGKTLLETGAVWHRRDLSSLIVAAEPRDLAGTIVLTPPLGNREVLIRFLAERARVIDHYHPAENTARDDLIRHRRNAWGVGLASENHQGISRLTDHLRQGGTVTFCPDQQPRLRGGHFVPFFGQPALTARSLARLVQTTEAAVCLGIAWRDPAGHAFRIQLRPVICDRAADDTAILAAINRALEAAIVEAPCQYRWSDKRFNIRPPGERKLYS